MHRAGREKLIAADSINLHEANILTVSELAIYLRVHQATTFIGSSSREIFQPSEEVQISDSIVLQLMRGYVGCISETNPGHRRFSVNGLRDVERGISLRSARCHG